MKTRKKFHDMKYFCRPLAATSPMKMRLKGFSLTEVLVALAIVGIVALIALPSLMPLISKAKSMEAQTALTHIHTLEKNYFFMHSKYSSDLNEIGFELNKTIQQGGQANYVFEVGTASNNTFKVKATSVTDFDGDGVMNVWEIDQDKNLKEVVVD